MTIADNATTTWIRRYHPTTSARTRLVCLPHAGGSASFFHPVSARFAPQVDVVCVQYPGRQDRRREPCIDDIGVLADRLTAELLQLSDRPTVLFGHSMGAVVAFETAWRLEQQGRHQPSALVATGRRAPSTHRDESVHRRDDDGLLAEVRALNGTASSLLEDDELIRMALPAIRGDFHAIETYTCAPGRRVRASITALTGDADPKTTIEENSAWRAHTEGEFRMKVFSGGHFFIATQQSAVNEEISRAVAGLSAASAV